ncbi:MAG: hypothetical protein HC881_03255 [Leptolyngbyaceae cyanobacterium SL_7_1]|nr:hypothetical protein [Leptolyngbyaceae cyanobacterium SL_7_1]
MKSSHVNPQDAATAKLIDTVLQDPLLLRKLSDRVYELIQETYLAQRDRTRE